MKFDQVRARVCGGRKNFEGFCGLCCNFEKLGVLRVGGVGL